MEHIRFAAMAGTAWDQLIESHEMKARIVTDHTIHKTLHVLHTITSLSRNYGGPAVSVSRLCEAMGKQHATIHLVSIASQQQTTRLLPDPVYAKICFAQTRFKTGNQILAIPAFKSLLSQLVVNGQIQVLHDHGLWLPCNFAAAQCARKYHLPLVLHPRGMLEPRALSYKKWAKQMVWKLYQRRIVCSAALLIATSAQEAQSIQKAGIFQPIAIIPNGVDMPAWVRVINRKKHIHTALFLSRIHPIKGLRNLVAAWRIIHPKDWQMIVAGPDEGGHLSEVKQAVKQAGIDKSFQFVGMVDGEKKEKLYQDADLFVLPTYSENFGLVVAEALSYGLPVITTKGAPWAGLTANRCGWWVDIGVKPLADALQDAIQLSDDERHEMGMRGRRYVEASFSWPRVATEMISCYQWILGVNDRPECVIAYR